MMLNLDASIGLASTFSFPTRTFPFDSTPNWSMIGAIAPQVGHQGAQAHISTGRGDCNTLSSKLPSVTMMGWGVNSSSVFNIMPHFPHLGPAPILLPGTLFLAPHSMQRILKLSRGAEDFFSSGRAVWHFPHLAATPVLSVGIRLAAPQLVQRTMWELLWFIIYLNSK